MPKKTGLVSIAVLAIVTLAVFSAVGAVAHAMPISAPLFSAQSSVNQVPDFSVAGASGAYSMNISSKGGYLSESGSKITVMPWGYATSQWITGTIDIIFLANVTQTDFYIDFLYVTNSSSQIVLRTFEYKGGDFNTIVFTGTQRISDRLVNTSSIPMPKLLFDVKAQADNTLSAIGPEIYVNGNYGTLLNGSITLNVASLRNQLFSGPTNYNELWSLLADGLGNYYFAILYMHNSDPSHVILEHQIKLNNLQTLPGKTLNAQWKSGRFTSGLTIRLPASSSIVKVDGFPFRTLNDGVLVVALTGNSATVQVPNELSSSNGTVLHFASWNNYGTANPLNVTLGGQIDLTAQYLAEYSLTIDTSYGKVKGAGSYLQDTNATFSVSPFVNSSNGTRRVFQRFSGDYNSASNTGWIIMNSSKRISVTWETQYAVTLQLSGLPANSTIAVNLNGNLQFVNNSRGIRLWVDQGGQLSIGVETTHINGTNVSYDFSGVQVDGQTQGSNITVTKPVAVVIAFSAQQKAPSSISFEVTPSSTLSGYPITISGSISAGSNSSIIALSYSTDKVNWSPVASVPTRQGGVFSYVWTPNTPGSYMVQAYWQGDADHAPTSAMMPVKVHSVLPANLDGSGSLANLVQEFSGAMKVVPFTSSLIGLAESLLAIGVVLAALLPGAPPIVSYFIGSVLVGFVFVFPISVSVLAFKAWRNRRSPSAVWLLPLFTVWVVTLAMLITGDTFLAFPQSLLAASTILLVLSNALLVPLAFSFLGARAVVG
jgi:hypothetical protein